jgi:ketosteroid isomerase-like protein
MGYPWAEIEGERMRVLSLFLLSLATCRIVVAQGPEGKLSESKDVLTLKQLEQDWLDSYREGDADKMGKILADDFIGRWADGSTTDKRGTVEPVRTGEDRHSSNQMLECNVRLFGETAVVTGIQTEQSLLSGRDGSGTYSYTDVIVKRQGRWQIVASETKRVARRSPSSEPSMRERLIGSWRQVSDEETMPDGSVVRADEIGFVTWDGTGHMSEQVMRRSASQAPSDATYLDNGYDAYFGTYAIEAGRTITHHVEGSVARQLVGKNLVRSVEFSGGRLILKPTNAGEHWTVVLEKIL